MSIHPIGIVGIRGHGITHGRHHGIMIRGMVHHGILLIIGDGIVIGDHHGIPVIIHVTLITTTITPARQLIDRPHRAPIDRLAQDKTIMHPGIDPAIEVKARLIDHLRVEAR